MSTQNLIKDSAKNLSDDRGEAYGDFLVVASMAQLMKATMRSDKFSDVQKESIDNICTKMARLRCGNPNDIDSWRDIAGYANLVVERLCAPKEY